jgi:hypothetical protein
VGTFANSVTVVTREANTASSLGPTLSRHCESMCNPQRWQWRLVTPSLQGKSFGSAISTSRVSLVHMAAFDAHTSVAAGKRTHGGNGCLTRKPMGSESARESPSPLVRTFLITLYTK